MTNVGLIGLGYWGTKYAKVLQSMGDVNLVSICKRSIKGYSQENMIFTIDIDDILYDENIDCVIVATPASTHTKIAEQCINAGKHALIEKPFTITSQAARDLIEMNAEKKLVIMPGHIYLHHSGIKKLKELIDFEVKNIFSKRMSLSKYPDALGEVALHDIYILQYLFGDISEIKSVMGNKKHCISNLRINDTEIYVESSTDYPGKIREMIIRGENKRLIFDEADKDYITVTDLNTKVVDFVKYDISKSPLELQCEHFFNCVKGKETPIVNEHSGLYTVEIIEQLHKLL